MHTAFCIELLGEPRRQVHPKPGSDVALVSKADGVVDRPHDVVQAERQRFEEEVAHPTLCRRPHSVTVKLRVARRHEVATVELVGSLSCAVELPSHNLVDEEG